MKKNALMILVLLLTSFALVACGSGDDDDDQPVLGAKVTVTLESTLGLTDVSNVTVYMFKDNEPDINTNKDDADRNVNTDENGKAVFDLQFYELNITASQTTLYFAIFYGDQIGRSEGVTVNRDDVKDVTISTLL